MSADTKPTAQGLQLEDLRKVYKSRGRETFEAVKGINMDIQPGELIALLGPSGCGKTTTLRMIAGLETVTGGDIRVGGQSIKEMKPGERNMGVGFESYALYPPLNVRENLAFGLRARKVVDVDERVAALAKRLDMEDMLEMRPAALSSGQKQRVALARALIRNPPVLLLDEPLSHLDAAQRERVRRELKLLQREFGYTTIVVTHDQLEALSLADRIAVMHDGVIQQLARPDELFDNPANQFVADFVGEPKINLVRGVVERVGSQALVRIGASSALPIAATSPEHGRTVMVGVRPQDVRTFDGIGSAPAIESTVFNYENLLEFGQATLDVKGVEERMVIVTHADENWEPGDVLRFTAAPERVYLFDVDSGARLR